MKKNFLKNDERLDDLLAEKMQIIQSPTVFSFSLDAVLLAYFCNPPGRNGGVIDLCTGNGVIPLLMSKRTKSSIIGVEIQPRLADMAKRSVDLNALNRQITILEQDLRTIFSRLKKETYSVVLCNPPYYNTPLASLKNQNEHFAIARHEIMCTLADVVQTSSELLKQGGKAHFVHRPERLLDLIDLMRRFRLEPKRIQFVHPFVRKEANMVLVEGAKDGKPGVKYLPPRIIHDEKGHYTKEVREMLYGKSQ